MAVTREGAKPRADRAFGGAQSPPVVQLDEETARDDERLDTRGRLKAHLGASSSESVSHGPQYRIGLTGKVSLSIRPREHAAQAQQLSAAADDCSTSIRATA